MREEDFRAWLAAQGQEVSSISTRLSDARRVQAHYGDLDGFYEQDRLAGLLAGLSYTAADRSARRPNPTPLAIDGDLYDSLASYRSAITTYRRFLDGAHEENELGSQADRIRRYVIETIIDPARRRGEATVDVVSGEIHRGMKLENAMPAVCSALGGGKFERLAGVKITDRNGPANSSTVRFRYALGVSSTDQLTPASEIVDAAPAAKETFMPENLILYGPPGTGKTFSTAAEAVRLCDGALPEDGDDAAVRRRYRELVNAKQVYFITFHQSYSYEDFVEGLRPTTREDDVTIDAEATGVPPTAGGLRLEPVAGVFREIATLAEQARKSATEGRRGNDFNLAGRRFWKMGLGAVGSEEHIYRAAIADGYVALGWGHDVDWSDSRFASLEEMRKEWEKRYPDDKTPSQTSQPWVLRNKVENGDLVIVPYGNFAFRAIAEVQGDYYFELSEDVRYNQRRKVRWLLTLDEPLPLDTIIEGNFTMRTLYEIPERRVRKEALIRLISRPQDGHEPTPPDQFVLIVDEINRADISKVFGELITLIEPDKRIGGDYELKATLPYSKISFGVPDNLHIVGTMNTADRSIALLDTALRRRFTFRELMPRPELLRTVDGIRLDRLLTAINERIEYFFDREHQIGHAFFMGCQGRADVDQVMRRRVIPLLAEYFFDDWNKLAVVLGDSNEGEGDRKGGFLDRRQLKVPTGLGDDGEAPPRYRWSVRDTFDYANLSVIRRTILEWESIAYGTSEGTIPQAAADRIAAVATASPLAGRGGGGVLEHGRKALRARGVVGVIAAANCALEILPKIDVPGETDATGRTGGIRKRLIHMLAVALDLRIEAGDITDHDYQRETLLEILIRLFSRKLADAVRQGMPRRYLVYADDLSALRGRLNVTRQFTILAASPQKLACCFGALSDDIALNRIMKAAVMRLGRIARSADNQHRLRELAFAYAEVNDVPIVMLRWDTVAIDRTNARWRQLLNLAKLLLGERFQTTSDGPGSGFSLLFQMNTLFEEYVARMLARALAGTGRKVVAQGGRLFCLETDESVKLFQTKPDILVKRNGAVEQVIDTKWKRIARRIDDPKQGVAQADVYQMMAYGQLYRCPRLMLLYPHYQALGVAALRVAHRIASDNCDDRLELATIDVGAGKGMINRLRELCPEIDPMWPQGGLS